MKTWVKVTLGVVLFFIAIGFFSSLISNSNPTGNVVSEEKQSEQYTAPSNTPPLEILSHNMDYNEYGNLIITGIAKNTKNRELSYAQIDVKFYDNEGNVISNSLDNINNLGAGETWKFEVMYLGLDTYNVGSYDISVGTTW